jgi:hydroxymethylpyrimidine kinase/phosphomethylpyrimidine kinase
MLSGRIKFLLQSLIRYYSCNITFDHNADNFEVMVATSGAQLLPEDAVEKLLQDLLPLTTILTPNLPEAKLLLRKANVNSKDPQTPDDLVKMAKALQKLGPKYVLLKGGHIPLTKDRKISTELTEDNIVFNVLAGPEVVETFETEYLKSKNTHGTGCSLACEYYTRCPSTPITDLYAKPQ